MEEFIGLSLCQDYRLHVRFVIFAATIYLLMMSSITGSFERLVPAKQDNFLSYLVIHVR